jgi:flagellar hook-length control protein FliK
VDLGSIDYGVGLQQAIEDLHGTIQLAARQGLSQARIALEPEELGEIRIHLTQTADGLLARVTADTPAAAQALAAGHAELRQSLSSLGINLARLNIGHHEQATAHGGGTAAGNPGRDGAATSGETSSRGTGSGNSTSARTTIEPAVSSNPEPEEDASPSPPRSSGALVDVLA